MIRSLAFLAILLSVTYSLVSQASKSTRDARQAILEADRAFARATAEKGLEGFLSFLTDDVQTLRPDSPIISGKKALGEHWAPLLNDPVLRIEWTPLEARMAPSNDFGFTLGSYRITRKDPAGETSVGTGKYVTIWARQADGSWKVVFDSGVEDTAPKT